MIPNLLPTPTISLSFDVAHWVHAQPTSHQIMLQVSGTEVRIPCEQVRWTCEPSPAKFPTLQIQAKGVFLLAGEREEMSQWFFVIATKERRKPPLRWLRFGKALRRSEYDGVGRRILPTAAFSSISFENSRLCYDCLCLHWVIDFRYKDTQFSTNSGTFLQFPFYRYNLLALITRPKHLQLASLPFIYQTSISWANNYAFNLPGFGAIQCHTLLAINLRTWRTIFFPLFFNAVNIQCVH